MSVNFKGTDPLHFVRKWQSQFPFIRTRHVENQTMNGYNLFKKLFHFYFILINSQHRKPRPFFSPIWSSEKSRQIIKNPFPCNVTNS